jgi:hypothetical protein
MHLQRFLAVSLLGAAFGAFPAHADRDAVQLFSDIHIAQDATVHDAVCFFCSVHSEGEVRGDVVVFFGNIHLAGRADHDVVNFFGKVTAEDNTQIGNDLVSMFGVIRLGENVSVGKDMVAMFGMARAPASVTVGGDRVAMPGAVLFIPFIVVGLIVVLIVSAVRSQRRRHILGGPGHPPWL